MNAASQIIELHYPFILKTCKSIKRKSIDESGDLAHDIVEKILKMDDKTIQRLKENPQGYITTMLRNNNGMQKRKENLLNKFRVEALYSRKPGEQQEVFSFDITDDPNEIAEKISRIKQLNQIDRMWLSVFITYPDTMECASKTGINRATIAHHKRRIQNILKR